MTGVMTVKEAAILWNLTERRVTSLCKDGKIAGARKQGRLWVIPIDSEKPADNRVKSGAYKKVSRPAKLPLPIGISDYRLASSEYYYIDKTMMIQALLTQSVSSFDAAGENFYYGFMLGLCALFGGTFFSSNKESGDGRYDIQLKPVNKNLPGILIELKAEKDCSGEQLKKLSEIALKQIIDKKYDTEMTSEGIKTIYKYGVAFSGKNVEITVG